MQGSTRGRAAAPDTAPDRLAGDRTASNRGGRRWEIVDFLRGCAIVAMIVYHFCFDLALNGWLVADFGEDLRWLAFRVPILGSFLFIAGLSLALAERRGQTALQFWRRVGIIAGAALLVSIGSFFVFPQSFIYFGVLHAIALMSVLARWLLPLGRWLPLLALGFCCWASSSNHPYSISPRCTDGMIFPGPGPTRPAFHGAVYPLGASIPHGWRKPPHAARRSSFPRRRLVRLGRPTAWGSTPTGRCCRSDAFASQAASTNPSA
jgi:hypothetical protein